MSARNPHKASRVNKGPSADDRFTPRYLIEALHKEFSFNVDAAGNPLAPAYDVIGRRWGPGVVGAEDALALDWVGKKVFVNPPFSQIPAWVEKAHVEARVGCLLIVMLLPWNRQEQPFWHAFIECRRDGKLLAGQEPFTVETRAIKGRVKYGTPDDPEGKRPHNSPNFGSGLVIWRRN